MDCSRALAAFNFNTSDCVCSRGSFRLDSLGLIMSRNYGLPYKGSKNKIAEDIVRILPPAHTLYDLFCGGCAITDCAMESGKFKHFVINDIDPRLPEFFRDALAGKFKSERRVIDKETFHLLKFTDLYVAVCWSFGTNCNSYLWNDELAEVKLAASRIILAETIQERRIYYRRFLDALIKQISSVDEDSQIKEKLEKLQTLESLERLERLQSLERLERLEQLVNPDNLRFLDWFTGDFTAVPIANDSVIYCDIPYKDTEGYQSGGVTLLIMKDFMNGLVHKTSLFLYLNIGCRKIYLNVFGKKKRCVFITIHQLKQLLKDFLFPRVKKNVDSLMESNLHWS